MVYKSETKCLILSLFIHILFFLFYSKELRHYPKIQENKEIHINLIENQSDISNEFTEETVVLNEKKEIKISNKPVEIKAVEAVKPKENNKNIEKEVVKTENIDSKSESEKSEVASGKNQNTGEVGDNLDEGIIFDSNGQKIGANQNIAGINYRILSYKDPKYPIIAKKFKLKDKVTVKTRFLVGMDGEIENIEIIEGPEKFGFTNAVLESLKEWKFSPVQYKGQTIKLYFYKDFIFKVE